MVTKRLQFGNKKLQSGNIVKHASSHAARPWKKRLHLAESIKKMPAINHF